MARGDRARPAAIVWDDRQGCWVVSSHALVRECLAADGDELSSNFSFLYRRTLPRKLHRQMAAVLELYDNVLTVQDDPYHAHVRAAVVPAFNRALKGSIPSIEAMIERRVSELEEQFDLVADLADPIAKDAIALVIDIPDERREALIGASLDLLASMEFGHERSAALSASNGAAAERALNTLRDFFEQQIVRFDPIRSQGLMAQLLRGGSEPRESDLSETERIYLSIAMLMAGFVTMTSLLARSIALLANDEEDATAIVAEAARFRQTVDSLTRRAGPTAYVMRHAIRQFSLGGNEIRVGDLLQLRLVEANNDPSIHDSPNENQKNLAFGEGIHVCPGMPMAKLLLTRTLEALARHGIRVRAAPDEVPELASPARAIVRYERWPAVIDTRT